MCSLPNFDMLAWFRLQHHVTGYVLDRTHASTEKWCIHFLKEYEICMCQDLKMFEKDYTILLAGNLDECWSSKNWELKMRFPTGYVVSVGLYCIILEIRAELPDNLECDSSNMGTLLFSGSAGGKVWFYIYNELISEDAAEILCECRNQTLAYPNTETYRLILKGLMKARSVPSVWVNGNKRIMSHWEFIDEDRTVLSRSEITQGSGLLKKL